MARKKPPPKKPAVQSHLIRDFTPRPDPNAIKEPTETPTTFLQKIQIFTDKTSLLLSQLLRDTFKRPEPYYDNEKRQKQIIQDAFKDDPGDIDEDVENDLIHGRFEVLPTKAIEEDFSKRVSRAGQKEGTAESPQTRITGSNYRQMYTGEQEAAAEKQKATVETTAQQQAKNDKEIAEKRQADDQRFRARELQNQIDWWKQQQGQGQHDDSAISGAVDTLERELNSIPQWLKPS
jgi:hypothetical protein